MAKTIALSGAEVKVTFSGGNAWLRNDGAAVVYASKTAGITAGADGVVSIPAGDAAPVYGANGQVFLLGTGSVQLIGSDYAANPFKTSAQAGGSGADEVARAAIDAHAGNAVIHVTAEEKAAWNAMNYSNPNLLINPDFRINQRGKSAYINEEFGQYTVDCWKLVEWNTTLTVGSEGVLVSSNNGGDFLLHLVQYLPDLTVQYGEPYTLSVNISGTIYTTSEVINSPSDKVEYWDGQFHFLFGFYSENNAWGVSLISDHGEPLDIHWAKLEMNAIATPFSSPNQTVEQLKCQRYYQIRSTGDIDPVDLRPSMRAISDIKQREDGNYEYIAEL